MVRDVTLYCRSVGWLLELKSCVVTNVHQSLTLMAYGLCHPHHQSPRSPCPPP